MPRTRASPVVTTGLGNRANFMSFGLSADEDITKGLVDTGGANSAPAGLAT